MGFTSTADSRIAVGPPMQTIAWAVLRDGHPFAWFADRKDAEQFASKANFTWWWQR